MSSEHVPIGQAARMVGVAASTLRFYEDRGLVRPVERVGGRRMYDRAGLRRLAFVRMAQRFDIDLERIGAVLNGSGPSWRTVVDVQLRTLAERIGDARSAVRLLEHAQECPHERPWRDCPYTIETLDGWLAAGGEVTFPEDPDLGELRASYRRGELDESEVDADPLEQFRRWLHDALAAEVTEPNAMVLATASPDGVPSARTVLLKGLDERGFVFYTNYESAKAAELDANPVAALVFPWYSIERQVRVTGTVERVDRSESAAYFASRPRESRLGAWASRQSAVVPDRATLDASYAELAARWPEETDIPLPDFWGGYRITPGTYEFWQGRTGRLHDRLRYRRSGGGDEWLLERLQP